MQIVRHFVLIQNENHAINSPIIVAVWNMICLVKPQWKTDARIYYCQFGIWGFIPNINRLH